MVATRWRVRLEALMRLLPARSNMTMMGNGNYERLSVADKKICTEKLESITTCWSWPRSETKRGSEMNSGKLDKILRTCGQCAR